MSKAVKVAEVVGGVLGLVLVVSLWAGGIYAAVRIAACAWGGSNAS